MSEKCFCEKKEFFSVYYNVIGYGRDCSFGVNFNDKCLSASYAPYCDQYLKNRVPISFCPFCGKRL